MLKLLVLLVCISIVVGGLLAVLLNDILAAVICAGLTGLFASSVFLLLAAPDVAMAEAGIGSGLATFIFLYALRKTGYFKGSP